MVVLRRLDCVLEPTVDSVHDEYVRLKNSKVPESVIEQKLAKIANRSGNQPLYNTSKFTFDRLISDPENIFQNLNAYINGFSSSARNIFEKFSFEIQIEKLESNNKLYNVVRQVAALDLHPDRVDNIQMGYLFEHLIMRFNEQANEEAGDHFTPREVIELMASVIYTDEKDVYKPGIYRTVYDPTCGTGGMLSVSENFIKKGNKNAHVALFGQEYNDESWAICCADMLIKGEATDQIIFGDTLGNGKSEDGHKGKKFHYMLANPPFGVDWKDQKGIVEKEHKNLGFKGRFGAGTPDIDDGSLLFVQHMISKMNPPLEEGGDGSKIAVVLNASPLFAGSAGGGPSCIRRWIIENDWLDAVIGLPDQLFYNTGIFTYIWIISNRKSPERKGKVQLIDGTLFFKKMEKSLNNKRNYISEDQINHITRIYGNYSDGEKAKVTVDKKTGKKEKRVISRILKNQDFGFLRVTIDRPLRMNFRVTPDRVKKLKDLSSRHPVDDIISVVKKMDSSQLYMNLVDFDRDIVLFAKRSKISLSKANRKAIWMALGEKDEAAEVCTWNRHLPEPDKDLRIHENIPFPSSVELPLQIGFHFDPKGKEFQSFIEDIKFVIDAYMESSILPHAPDAWVDYKKTKIGYEIPFSSYFFVYKKPRDLHIIMREIDDLQGEVSDLLKGLFR